jgi:hypothetical protein
MKMLGKKIGMLALGTLLLAGCGGHAGRDAAIGAASGAAGSATAAAIRGDDVMENAAVGAASGATAGAAAGFVARIFLVETDPRRFGTRFRCRCCTARLRGWLFPVSLHGHLVHAILGIRPPAKK